MPPPDVTFPLMTTEYPALGDDEITVLVATQRLMRMLDLHAKRRILRYLLDRAGDDQAAPS